jgi:glycosyltransferase involved in cell wall biosynthesis
MDIIVSIVMPVFKHSSLLVDAIESALCQDTIYPYKIIIVNDGCPHKETRFVGKSYALSYPDKVVYLEKVNGGLSDARNFGVRFSLSKYPKIEAIYFLDADNIIKPKVIERSLDILRSSSDIGWVYPSIDMFGMEWCGEYSGSYSLFIHSIMNVSEAGSMVRRSIFDQGIFFDTNFKLGWEDWDFFLTIASNGFRGVSLEYIGFQYRKRPESMLADSSRDSSLIASAMNKKHNHLLSVSNLITLEHENHPRYLLSLNKSYSIFTDIARPINNVFLDGVDKAYWDSLGSRGKIHFPSFIIFGTESVLSLLEKNKLTAWVLWRLEKLLLQKGIAFVYINYNGKRLGFSEEHGLPNVDKKPSIIMLSPYLLSEVLADSNGTSWIDSISTDFPNPQISKLTITVTQSDDIENSDAIIDNFLDFIHVLYDSEYKKSALISWSWRQNGIPFRRNSYDVMRLNYGGEPVVPRILNSRRHICFVLPLVEFGGVEKVALGIAEGLKSRGWVPHLLILKSDSMANISGIFELFETISFLGQHDFDVWGESKSFYLGTNIPYWATDGNHQSALSLLHDMNVVINFHGGAINGLMAELRRKGITTCNSLHLSDISDFGRPVGNTYLGIAYEHAYDLFLPCSKSLGNWLHGMGVPNDKILPVVNAPSFALSCDHIERHLRSKLDRKQGTPLRVLYLGRFDRQKGIERLEELLIKTRPIQHDIHWRFIGGVVLEEHKHLFNYETNICVEPPIYDAQQLADVFEWADVLILLSHYEGLPLTILEAMRSGVVPISTNVGAINEIINDDIDGILINSSVVIEHSYSQLVKFHQDRQLLKKFAIQAHNKMLSHDWISSTQDLAENLARRF